MSDDELYFADIAELSRLLRSGKLSPVELTQVFLDRISALDPTLHAYATILAEEALDALRRSSRAALREGLCTACPLR